MAKKEFYAGVWLGVQNFDTVINNQYEIKDIIGHAPTLEQCKHNIKNANLEDDLEGRRFAIIKVQHIEDVDYSLI